MSNIYLVTGANSGLGLDSVRNLALMPSTKRVYMACRSEIKAQAAMDSLDESVDRSKLKYIHFDASESKDRIFESAESIEDGSLTGVLLNAGGMGDNKKNTKEPTGPNHVLDIYQINVIGAIQLLECLKPKLATGCHIVYAGSEAARGVPSMMVRTPKLGDTSQWYKDHLEGNDLKGKDTMAIYAESKAFGALYFAHWAHQNPDYTVLVVSPGGTSGTSAMSAKAFPTSYKVMMPLMMPLLKVSGVMHNLEDGTDRFMKAITGEYDDYYPSGTFVASKSGSTGKVADQSTLRSGRAFSDPQKQQAAFEALSAYTMVA